MESGLPEELDSDVAETLDARVFNPSMELGESTSSVPQPPISTSPPPATTGNTTTDPDPPASEQLPPSVPNDIKHPETETPPQKNPLLPHLPSKYAETYELEKFNENRMIIFNHDIFSKGPPRPGTLEDETFLRRTFEKFRFKIDPTHRNLKKKMLIDMVKNFALKTDFARYGCICVVIMTHGHTQPGFLLAFDSPYNEHEIFEHFDASKNPSLAAKPVIFIIQACRGAEPSPIIEARKRSLSPVAQLDDGEEREFYHLPMDADRVVFHSSYIGRASVRHPRRGSWFIQALCKKINKYALTHDLETIFRLVKREVALDYVTVKDWKQMPVVSSTTIREIRLASNISPQNESKDNNMVHSPVQLSNLNLSEVPEKPTDLSVSDVTTPDDSFIPMQPHHMPCSCFLEYFEYLKNCLRSFVYHNAEDSVAINLLVMAERAGDGAEYNLHKFSLIRSVWEHFEINLHRFPPEGSTFVHRLYH